MSIDNDDLTKKSTLENPLAENHPHRGSTKKTFFAAFFKIFSGMLFMYCFSYVAISWAEGIGIFLGDKGSFLMGAIKMVKKEILILPLWVIGFLFIMIINYYVLFHDRSSEDEEGLLNIREIIYDFCDHFSKKR